MWFNKFPNHVPYAKGPYIPSCCDVMFDYSKTGLFLRFYYPTDYSGDIKSYAQQWTRWVPHDSYLVGFGKVLMLWLFIVRLVIWFMSGKLYVPALYGAKVKSNTELKCIILSHGLGGHRFLYTSTCINLASHGYVVLALEHRDESPCRTYYYKSKNDVENDIKTFIEHAPVQLGNDHYIVRNNQVHQRAEECKKVFNVILDINKGDVPYNILKDSPNEQNTEFDLKQLVNRIDINNITMMGHSFGGATSLVTMAQEKRIKQGILLDPWMFPIKNMKELLKEVNQSLLFVNTQTFHIASNINVMKLFTDINKEMRPMYTIKHTTHESQTDSVFVAGYWLNWFMKKLPANKSARINNALIIRYLKERVGIPKNITEYEDYLLKENDNYYFGLTKPWA